MAKYDYKALKNIEEKIERVMDRLNLQSEIPVSFSIKSKQNFYVVDTVYKNQRVMFKARVSDHRVLKQWGKNFENERRFLRTLKKFDPENPILLRMPQYIKSQMKSCEWLMCEYINSKTIGSSAISYDSPSNKEIDKIIELILDIQNFPIEQFCLTHHWTKNFKYGDFTSYHEFSHKIRKRLKKLIHQAISEEMLEEADRILRSNHDLLNGACTLLTHGDFHPGNIIVPDKAIAIDWEELHIDNASCDVADLWLRMIDHPKERSYFLTKFAKVNQQKDYFQDLFRLSILTKLPDEISVLIRHHNRSEEGSENQKRLKKLIKRSQSNFYCALRNDSLEKYE